MRTLKPTTQLWLGVWEVMQDRSDELFRTLTRDCKRLDLEAVHDLRVASRRLREGLSLFSPCFPKRHLTPLRARLKQLTRTLGPLRNSDEALHFFSSLSRNPHGQIHTAAQELVLALQAQREEERATLKKKLKLISPTALRVLFDHTCNNPLIFNTSKVDPLQPIADFLRSAITKRETPLYELYPRACIAENVVDQHRLRIAIKRFRYRLEYFSFLSGPDYAELYSQTKGFHDILGHLHDLDVFSGMVTAKVVDPLAHGAMQSLIAGKRHELFAEFLRQDALCPVTSLGERLRRLL